MMNDICFAIVLLVLETLFGVTVFFGGYILGKTNERRKNFMESLEDEQNG